MKDGDAREVDNISVGTGNVVNNAGLNVFSLEGQLKSEAPERISPEWEPIIFKSDQRIAQRANQRAVTL